MTMLLRVMTDPEEIKEARQKAREKFEEELIRRYGYVIFNEEYLSRQWPS